MKDPAVLFYFQDFLVGTEFMTDDEVGKYIRILCHLADKGTLSLLHMKKICNSQNVPEIIMSKLKRDEEGNYFQERMRREREKRTNYCESRRNNRNKKDEDICITYVPHMENENVNIVYSSFYDKEIQKSNNDESYLRFVKFMFGENDLQRPLNKLINMNDQIKYEQFIALKKKAAENNVKLLDTIRNLENYTKKTYSSFYLTLNKWLNPKKDVR